MILKGKNTTLRPIGKSDIDNFLRWFNDPEATKYLTQYLPLTEEYESDWIHNTTFERKPIFVIEIKSPNNLPIPIGNCGLHEIKQKDMCATLGIAIGEKDYWDIGYGSEAARLIIEYGFNTLNLNRIESSALAYNKRSICMHKKIGFKSEGIQYQKMFKGGSYQDIMLFGILREDWHQ